MPLLPALALLAAGADYGPALRALQAIDQRVETIGYRLATAGADLCRTTAPLPGFTIHDLSEYIGPAQAQARATFGLDEAPQVLAVAAGGAADLAGLRAGDAIVAIDGAAPVPAPTGRASFARAEAVLDQVAAASRGVLTLSVRRDGVVRTIAYRPPSGCATRFLVAQDNALNAGADGQVVQVTTRLALYAAEDGELAAVLAHELAHNALGHPQALRAAGVRHGLFGEFGRSAGLTRRTEDEADRLSAYLLDRAGYDPQAAVAFWRRLGREHSAGLFRSATHASEDDRAAAITREAETIRAARAAGRVPRPEWRSDDSDRRSPP